MVYLQIITCNKGSDKLGLMLVWVRTDRYKYR